MAKMRVYELARELNMESKELVKKLVSAGLEIKNYMSTLDEEMIARARDIVSGAVSEIVEEKRIKPRIIRRRKKTIKVEPEVAPEVPEKEEATTPPELPMVEKEVIERPKEVKTEEKVPKTPVEEKTPKAEAIEKQKSSKETEAVELRKPEKKEESAKAKIKRPPKAKKKEARKKTKKRKDTPAKIIKRPEEGPLKHLLEKKLHAEEEKKEEIPERISLKEIPTPPEPEKPSKPSKKKKEKKKHEPKEEIPKKAIRHRKIEIFEKADLYEGRAFRWKEKKAVKKPKEGEKELKKPEITVPKAIKRKIKIQDSITVSELAKALGIKAVELIKKLMGMGVVAHINQSLDFETASLVADEYGYEVEQEVIKWEDMIQEEEDKEEDLKPRPPVVTIMGHVDHGKTSLLDYIRKSKIIEEESGGITQHIGAYYVKRDGGDIVFLDTPGHEAFTAMRARGAKVTDIIVLVVAADDGVMPQTIEAINHAKAADIPIVVAINKIDKPDANPDMVKRQLAEQGLVPEEWGGDTIMGNISAKTGEGVDELLELIQLQAEILELKANPSKKARGTVIESRLDKTKGPMATVLIKTGTLHQGDPFVCGLCYGRVRAMTDHKGRRMKSAGSSVPVEIYGISDVPNAGDEFIVVKDEKMAKQIADYRKSISKTPETAPKGIVSLDDLYQKIKEGEIKELNLIIKADVQGSIEAISDSLLKLSENEVRIKILHSSPGAITESDIMLASASNAIIIGFNVRPNPRVSDLAKKENVDIRYYDVIYNVIKDIKDAIRGMLKPEFKEEVIGRVEVKETFRVPKVGTVAGCLVLDGKIERNAKVRLLRDDVVVYDGKVASLKRFKDDVKEVQSGYECGVGLDNFQDIKPGDIIEVYRIEEVRPDI